jgi:hypothetical protein
MKKIILDELIEVYRRKNYKIFDNGIPYNLNIGIIRTKDMIPNKFNDWIYCFYKDESGKQKFHCWPATTDPGLYYLRYPFQPEADLHQRRMNLWLKLSAEYKKGTAILAPDQYLGCWRLGLHKGKYKALVQTGNVKVYRDANRDDKYDYIESSAEWGLFGINIHRASKWGIVNYINKFSAGCQVFENTGHFNQFIKICEKSLNYFSDRFSYTLIEEKDYN